MSDDALRQAALEYHAAPRPGKIGTHVFKPADSSRDLALAYSPGVAEPVLAIAANPEAAYKYTNKGNLIGIVTDGSAILGLGNLGALASKPVMEGKALLFKRFAELDCVDIEVDTDNVDDFVDTVARIADSFGGINIEDVGAPQCFAIEAALKARCKVPVFHDDQHGTAICVVAGLLNALEIQGKKLDQVRVVCLGSGAAGTATLRLLRSMGVPLDHLTAVDRQGVVHADRGPLPDYKAEFARHTSARTLADALKDADVFIGVSAGGLLDAELLRAMAPKPVIFALANPEPEVRPSVARAIRDDVIVATGRSDFPNQVNNVLCFPFIFRGALDVRAHAITEEMKVAAAQAIARLAKESVPPDVLAAYPDVDSLSFGPDYILPKPMDPRLRDVVASAVAKAAIASGVAAKPYPPHYPA